jgi:hypothetical protein
MASRMLRWSYEPLPPPPDPADPAVEVWRDLSGRIGALGERGAGWLRLHLPGLASFEFTLTGDEVVVRAASSARPETVEDQFHRTALPLVLQARGREVLHASAVTTPAGVVALCAEKENGKSTLAYALARRGYPLWADDAVAIELEDERAWTVSVPFTLRLRPASASHFEVAASSPPADPSVPRVVVTGAGGARAPMRAIFVLTRLRTVGDATTAIEVRRLDASDAFTALLANAYCFSLGDADRKQAMMRHYLALTRSLPVHALSYPSGLEHVEAILDTVEQTLAAGAPRD